MSLRVLGKDARFALGLLRRRPFQVLVQVTNRCNMRCSFCDFWPNPALRAEELTLGELERVADELSELGCFLVSIEGGEPLVRPDLPEIVRAFARRHVPVLFTNGWYVDAGKARALFDAGLVHASVSIDYATAELHDRKRGLEGATERAWRALEALRDAAPRGGLQVHVMTVLMQSNQHELEALLEQSRGRGVGHQFTLLALQGFRRAKLGADRPPAPEVAEALCRLHARYPHLRFFSDYFRGVGTFLRGEPMPGCRAGLQSFNIDHVGNVSPCIERIDEPVGNVRESSLEELHQRLLGRHPELASCQRCFTACRGFHQALGAGGTLRGWRELGQRMRSS